MTQAKLDGLRVGIVLSDGFEQVEMTEPRKALQDAGAKTFLVAPKPGQVQGMNHDTKADQFPVDLVLSQVDASQFDALLLPGGALNADFLRVDRDAQGLVRSFDRDGKPIASICHAPWLLVSANLVRGRTLTSYHTIQDDIRNAGGTWQDKEVVQDRNWVSSRQPGDIPAFNQALIDLFAQTAGQRAQATASTRR
jgi:protease I